jgi:Fe-S cluster biogenesis protein NfuA
LQRILEHLAEGSDACRGVLDALARDDLVSGLLLLYGLHPQDLPARVRLALDRVRPSLRKHGAKVELVDVTGTVVRLRVRTEGHACTSTSLSLRQILEDAVYDRAPEVTAVEVAGLAEAPAGAPAAFVPLEQLLESLSDKRRRVNGHGSGND